MREQSWRAFSPSCYWLSNSLSSLPALKKGTFFAGTATVAPVFGLRPSFIRRDRSRKLPNPRISVLSPFFKESRTQSKIVFTTISACRLVNVVTCSETRSIICAFVIFGLPFRYGERARRFIWLKGHEVLEADAGIRIEIGNQHRQSGFDEFPDRETAPRLDDFRLAFNAREFGGKLNGVVQI